MKRYIIIVAGGAGLRMGTSIPKQFLPLLGRPVLMHTIERFYQFDNTIEIIVVLPQNQIDYWEKLCSTHNFSITHRIAIGGETRYASVCNGFALIEGNAIVGIHDGVRPLVSTDTLKRCYSEAEQYGSAIPVTSAIESVRIVDADYNHAIDRSVVRLVQTPQVFSSDILRKAYALPYQPTFTDDASVVESAKYPIHLTNGNRENIKLTTPIDMELAEIILKKVIF